jgi:hypothetical protein
MNTENSSLEKIEAREVPSDQRLDVLPKRFGHHMLTVENAIYDFMAAHARTYRGGFWKFVELTNGGFYMAPVGEAIFDVHIEGNGFEGAMSSDAAGITACLFAFSHLSFQIQSDALVNHFYQLRDFALEHAEATAILAAID